MKIAISSDTSIDMTEEQKKEFEIHTLPFAVAFGNEIKFDGEFPTSEIFEYTNRTGEVPQTSAINDYQYQEHFDKLLKDYDAVIHLSIGSNISSACNNAMRVGKEMENVYVVDTKTLCTGLALLCIYAKELVDQGLEPEAVVEKIEQRKDSVSVSFVVKQLKYLKKGGRCSMLQLLGANLLQIRPKIEVVDYKIIASKKYRGEFNSVVRKYAMEHLEEYNTPNLKYGFISYTTASPEIIEELKNLMLKIGFKRVFITPAAATISTHVGTDAIGIIYMNDGDEKIDLQLLNN